MEEWSENWEALYSQAKDSNDFLELNIPGRAPSVLVKVQGDHVTAHRLVGEGLFRSVGRISVDEVDALFNLANRTRLRERRSDL